jgi:hypothetical protein
VLSPESSFHQPPRTSFDPHSHIAWPPQVLAVLAYAHENDVEPFLEPALHLCNALLSDVGEWQLGMQSSAVLFLGSCFQGRAHTLAGLSCSGPACLA